MKKITEFEINRATVATDAEDACAEVYIDMTMDTDAAQELFELIQNDNLAFTDRSEDTTCCGCCCESDPGDYEAEDDGAVYEDDCDIDCLDEEDSDPAVKIAALRAENAMVHMINRAYEGATAAIRIKNIYYSDKPGEEVVVVVFEDDKKVITRPHGGDTFDLKIGVALAIAEKMFGSKSQFGKFLVKNAKNTGAVAKARKENHAAKKAAKHETMNLKKPKDKKSAK